jgi:hypothetical protein
MKTTIRVYRLESDDHESEINTVMEALREPNTAKSHLRNQVRLVSVYAVDDVAYAVYEVTEPTLR